MAFFFAIFALFCGYLISVLTLAPGAPLASLREALRGQGLGVRFFLFPLWVLWASVRFSVPHVLGRPVVIPV